MKTFKFNSKILIICCALIASGNSAVRTPIGSDGREYLIEYEQKYTWSQAADQCARHNRQLLTIDSPEKQNVIDTLFEEASRDTFLWLGAYDGFNSSDNAGQPFFWSATGKQFTYANWEEGYPHNIWSKQHCIQINALTAKWLNWMCDSKAGFVCEQKPLLESSNKNPINASDTVQQLTKDFDLKFLSLLKNNMADLNGRLEKIEQVGNVTKSEVDKLTNIIQTSVQKILNKQELAAKELNHEITKQGSDLSDQLKQTADELNGKFSEKRNFTYPPNVLIKQIF